MRPVVFVKYYEKGSTIMGADQISAALQAAGADARSLPVAEIGAVRDAILVFIKTSKLPDLWAARRRGNRLVLDVQDTVCFKRRIKNRRLFDALIFKNRRQHADFGDRRRVGAVIWHQWDPRYLRHRAGESELRPAYLGLERSLTIYGQIPGVACVNGDYFERALEFNCHISIRESRRDWLYKPGTKIATAAGCGAGLITTRDESALEMLGEDYPFYCEPTLAGVLEAVERTRAALGGPQWQAAREVLERLRERTSVERIAQDYLELFGRLD